jgi:phage-related protein
MSRVLTFVNKEVNMRLVRIGKAQWEVLAVVDSRGHCQVLDFLKELGPGLFAVQRVLVRLLREQWPEEGPPTHNPQLCKSLGEGIFELRRQPKGPKLRLLFFYDEGYRIVFTNAFSKAETTPQAEIELARRLKEQYCMAKRLRRLQILEEI